MDNGDSSENGPRPFEDDQTFVSDGSKGGTLMEKRLGVIAILLTKTEPVSTLNTLLSGFADIVLARQGLPLRDKGIHVISLVVEGTTDRIGALTGKLGRLDGCKVKSVLTEYREDTDEHIGSGDDRGD